MVYCSPFNTHLVTSSSSSREMELYKERVEDLQTLFNREAKPSAHIIQGRGTGWHKAQGSQSISTHHSGQGHWMTQGSGKPIHQHTSFRAGALDDTRLREANPSAHINQGQGTGWHKDSRTTLQYTFVEMKIRPKMWYCGHGIAEPSVVSQAWAKLRFLLH